MTSSNDWRLQSATVLFESLAKEGDISDDEKLLLTKYVIDPRIYGRLIFFLEAYSIMRGINSWGAQSGRTTDEKDVIAAYGAIWDGIQKANVSMFDECKRHLALYQVSSLNAAKTAAEGGTPLGIRKAFGELLGAYQELKEEPILLLPYAERYYVEKVRFTVRTLNELSIR
jgi:hypothetical protein